MSKYISGHEIIETKGIQHFEFFSDYIKKGLQPHDSLGRPISPKDAVRLKKKVLEANGVDLQLYESENDWAKVDLPESWVGGQAILVGLLDALYKIADVEGIGASLNGASYTKPNSKKAPQRRSSSIVADQCREKAKELWELHPDINSTGEMAKHPEIEKIGGVYTVERRQRWISTIAPDHARKPGVRSKKK